MFCLAEFYDPSKHATSADSAIEMGRLRILLELAERSGSYNPVRIIHRWLWNHVGQREISPLPPPPSSLRIGTSFSSPIFDTGIANSVTSIESS
jgi:hypothetical protein